MDDAEMLREAARLMREQHGPQHERYSMWAAMADLIDESAERVEAAGRLGLLRLYRSRERGAVTVALAYLAAAVRAEPSETTRD